MSTIKARDGSKTRTGNDSDNWPTSETDRPNISTEHQDEGDARRPRDTLDREPERNQAGMPISKGYRGDGVEDAAGEIREDVDDRPVVGEVESDDYPRDQRAGRRP